MIKKNISFALLASLIRLILGLIIFVLISRALTLSDFGSYIYIIVVTGYFSILTDFGFNLSVLNDVPKNKKRVKNFFFEIMFAKSILVIISLFLLIMFIALMNEEKNTYVFILFMCVAILQSYSSLIAHLFKSFNKFDIDFYYVVITSVPCLIIIYLYQYELNLLELGLIFVISRVIGFAYLVVYFVSYFSNMHVIDNVQLSLKPLKKNFKYAIHMVIGGMLLSIDIPIMKEVLTLEDVAIYSVGMKIFVALVLIGDVTNTSFMPKLAGDIKEDYPLFITNVKKLIRLMFLLGLFFGAMLLLFGESGILIVFGPDFEPLVPLVPLFSLALFIRFLSMAYGNLLTLAEKQLYRARIIVVVFVLHVIFNIIFQDQMGVQGAIIAFCLSFFILTISNMYVVYKHYGSLFLFHGKNK